MNIKIKENPTITIEDCDLYAVKKTALFHTEMFRKELEEYRATTKTAINDIAYGHKGCHYHVRLTKSGNIKVKMLSK